MKRVIVFLDSNRNKITVEIEHQRDHFSFVGEHTNRAGQVCDYIKPYNEQQQELLDLWEKHHLVSTREYPQESIDAIWSDITLCCNEIEDAENARSEEPITEEDIDLFDSYNDPELVLAVAMMCGLCKNEIDDIDEDGNRFTVQGIEYLAGDDETMDRFWDDELEQYIDECVLPEIPETYRYYFDNEKFKDDCRYDGRAHSLNRYDGGEDSIIVNGTNYYMYRQ